MLKLAEQYIHVDMSTGSLYLLSYPTIYTMYKKNNLQQKE